MLNARVTRNVTVLLILFLAGMVILAQTVYPEADSGVTSNIIWSIAVGKLNDDYSETYSYHNYSIQLDIDVAAGVYASYEFAHFVHDRTEEIVVREVKVLEDGEPLYNAHEEDYYSQGLGTSIYGLTPSNDYEIEAYTRLEIYKGNKRVKEPGNAERKVTEFFDITME